MYFNILLFCTCRQSSLNAPNDVHIRTRRMKVLFVKCTCTKNRKQCMLRFFFQTQLIGSFMKKEVFACIKQKKKQVEIFTMLIHLKFSIDFFFEQITMPSLSHSCWFGSFAYTLNICGHNKNRLIRIIYDIWMFVMATDWKTVITFFLLQNNFIYESLFVCALFAFFFFSFVSPYFAYKRNNRRISLTWKDFAIFARFVMALHHTIWDFFDTQF